MAEWLGRGLQNLVQRFESASDLNSIPEDANFKALRGFLYQPEPRREPRRYYFSATSNMSAPKASSCFVDA